MKPSPRGVALPGAVPARVDELFRAQAERSPWAPAVLFAGQEWTYAELDRRSDRVAARLTAAGAGLEDRVAVCLERSPRLIAALLGVLKAGAAYVPLDPAYPVERLAFMLGDSGARWALTEAATAEALPAFDGETLLLGEGGEPAAAEGSREAARAPAPGLPDRLAYVIYTSGSTGRPKGVAIPHAPVTQLLAWARGVFGRDELAGVMAATSVCFDLSVFELFLPLTTGGAVVLARDALELPRLADARRVTLVNTVPAAMSDLLRSGGLPPSVKTVNLAGEPLARPLVERIYATGTVRRVLNLYGPSEDTTYSTWSEVERGAERPVTIGVPLTGTRAHVVDGALRPAGDGAAGELLLAGRGLARGYLARPALTAERWLPDPFVSGASEVGGRLYRTGDLVRRRQDDRLDFLGRIDHQVKVRGFRIELGEVEAALLRRPAVAEAVAVADGERPEDRRLVAYWVGVAGAVAPGGLPGEGDLKQALARELPGYMVPARILRLDVLPRMPNGKVDRAELPAPESVRPDGVAAYREPSAGHERNLAGWWAALLGLERAGADDSLFELGGHSLIATQVAARVRETYGVDLPPVEVFEHPTPAALAGRIRELAALATGGGEPPSAAVTPAASPTPPPLLPAPRDLKLPLSFPQEQIWLIQQLAPEMLAYNFQFTIRLRGALDRGLLARTLAEIVERHEIYRTTFPAVDGEPVQRIHPPWEPELPVADLSALPAGRREAAAEAAVVLRVRRRFDVTRLPLLEWALLRLAADDWMLIQAEHHFVHDGWSIAVLVHEMTAIYGDLAAGRPLSLAAPAVQFADFAVWQRQWLTGEVLAGELEAWRGRLGDPPPPLELPTDRPRPRRQSFRGDRFDADLPPDLYAAVRAFGRRQGYTLFMTMLAAFEVLLHRYSGRTTFLLGSGVANRRLRELEGLLGMVVNTLVLRADLGGRPSFLDLLARVRREALFMQAHQDLPFEALVAELAPDRDLSRNPLFAHLFSFHDAPVPDIRMAGPTGELTGELLERRNGSAKADWNVIVRPRAEQRVGRAASAEDDVLRVLWEFSSDLYDRATVARAWGHYQELLRGAIASPERAPGELPLLTAPERSQIVAQSVGEPEAEGEAPVAARVLARAAAAPGDAAVVDADGTVLSYGDLAARSTRLARRLTTSGVGYGGLVAVCMPPSADLAVAALAALSAGAAYLPLDPLHPAERRAYSLADSAADALIVAGTSAAGEIQAAWPEAERGGLPTVLDVGADSAPSGPAGGDGASSSPPALRHEPEALAYVIYTSGTTGRPKGTELTHRGLANLVAWHLRTYRLGAGDRVSLVASPAFDASVWELWPALASGATVCVPPAEVKAEPVRLAEWLGDERIAVSFLPTPLAEETLAAVAGVAAESGPAPSLRALLTGGDRLHRVPAGLSFPVINHYGPTEATVVTTAGAAPAGVDGPPIGRPIDGFAVRLLDRDLGLVPSGVPGELWVAGAGLARGYLRRPGLTADRFRPDPLAAEPGARMYRSGDLARWLTSGELDFLGRADDQVQVRGVRVEPAEVEAVLEEHPGVRRAAVVATPSGDRLAAFWVPAADPPPSPRELAHHAAQRLPEAAVPATLEALAELPLAATGKVDRRELERRAGEHADRSAPGARPATGEGVAPRTALEAAVAGVWEEVLGASGVGAHDGFFRDLGGHSLLAARTVARLRRVFGVELALAELFDRPTPAATAALVGERMRDAGGDAEEPIPRADRAHPLPLSFGQERLWLVDRLIADRSTYTVARAWSLRGRLDVAALRAAVADLSFRHEALRTRFPEGSDGDGDGDSVGDRGPIQEIGPVGEAPPVLLADLSALPEGCRGAEEERLTRGWTRTAFDLAAGPLTRLALLRRQPDGHRLLLAQHHAISDAWSLRILLSELSAAYAARADGRAPELPPLPVQPADVAVWQRQRLSGERLEELLAWWRQALDGVPGQLDLPTDRPRAAVQRQRGGRVASRLAPAELSRVGELARDAGATAFMTLLAGWAVVLGRWADQGGVVIGAPVAARERPETEGLLGFFVNTLALPVRLGGASGFAELLERVRTTALGAFAHAELPFERLVDELTTSRDLSGSPLFQVTLALQNAGRGELVLDGVTAEPSALDRREAHFDLTLFAQEDGGALELLWSYDRDLFDAATVERMAGHLATLLAAAAADPRAGLLDLPLMAEAERRQVLEEWNRTAAGYPRDRGLWQLFLAAAESAPEAPALVWEDSSLSYRELAGRATAVAAELRRHGVRAETPVGLALGRSPEMVTAVLGTLAAGGAYLPLDPSYPAERLLFMVADGGAPVVLVDAECEGSLPPIEGVTRVRVRAAEAGGGADPTAAAATSPPAATCGDALAYLMYTSGSTGRPKAVAVTHRNVARLVLGADFARFGPGRVFLQLAPISFDAATLEIWGPLLTGGCLALMPPGPVDAVELGAAIERFGVTTLWLTSGLFHQIVDEAAPSLAPLDELLAGGDVLSPERLRRAREAMPETVLINGYGPTENTTFTACHRMPPGAPIPAPVPIGRPIANTRAYLLDRRLRPVPVGVAGELYAAGDGVARGYHRRPAGTAAAFLPDPFAAEAGLGTAAPGARLYRTGDLARWRPDGTLEFLGRRDHQVKLRGIRIELGEIEGRLAAAPGVGACAVMLREDRKDDPRLAAYVVPSGESQEALAAVAPRDLEPDGERPDAAGLRIWLAERLPEAMVPADVVVLDRLPLTANGKVDRKALPAPERKRRTDGEFIAPRTATERRIAALWAEALGLERVGASDDFFALGGNSLLATRVMARVRREIGADLHLRSFFLHPTVEGLAGEVDRAAGGAPPPDRDGEGPSRAPTIRRVPRAGRRKAMEELTDG